MAKTRTWTATVTSSERRRGKGNMGGGERWQESMNMNLVQCRVHLMRKGRWTGLGWLWKPGLLGDQGEGWTS